MISVTCAWLVPIVLFDDANYNCDSYEDFNDYCLLLTRVT